MRVKCWNIENYQKRVSFLFLLQIEIITNKSQSITTQLRGKILPYIKFKKETISAAQCFFLFRKTSINYSQDSNIQFVQLKNEEINLENDQISMRQGPIFHVPRTWEVCIPWDVPEETFFHQHSNCRSCNSLGPNESCFCRWHRVPEFAMADCSKLRCKNFPMR